MCDLVIHFHVKGDTLDVIKYIKKMSLNCMCIGGLPQYLKQGWVRYEEESREDESFLLQVARE